MTMLTCVTAKNEKMKAKCGQHHIVSETAGSHSNDKAL